MLSKSKNETPMAIATRILPCNCRNHRRITTYRRRNGMQLQGCRSNEKIAKGNCTTTTHKFESKLWSDAPVAPKEDKSTAENSNYRYRKAQKQPSATFNDMSKKDKGNHVIMDGREPTKERSNSNRSHGRIAPVAPKERKIHR